MNDKIAGNLGQNMPDLTRKELHAHVEGCLTQEETAVLEQLGFHPDDFLKRDQIEDLWQRILSVRGFTLETLLSGIPYNEHLHWTRTLPGKTDSIPIFDGIKRETMALIEEHLKDSTGDGSLGAYSEYEAAWVYSLSPTTKTFDPTIQIPFSWNLRNAPPIKEAEVHFTVNSDADPQLIHRLVDAGMYVVIWPKQTGDPGNMEIILTAQGTFDEIRALSIRLWQYLQEAGGYGTEAEILIERLVDWKQTLVAKLPRVIDSESLRML